MITTSKKTLSDPPFHAIIEDTIKHNIAQMTSTSKVYILCFFATIIKWCQIIAWDRRQHRDDGQRRTTQKIHDIEGSAK